MAMVIKRHRRRDLFGGDEGVVEGFGLVNDELARALILMLLLLSDVILWIGKVFDRIYTYRRILLLPKDLCSPNNRVSLRYNLLKIKFDWRLHNLLLKAL